MISPTLAQNNLAFLLRPRQNPLFDGVFGDEAIDSDLAGLTQAVRPVHGLRHMVMGGVVSGGNRCMLPPRKSPAPQLYYINASVKAANTNFST